jgi:hypothetical protein
MSYVKIWLPEKSVLIKELKKEPDKIKYYLKYDTYMGSFESITYFRKKLKKFRK